MGPGPLRLLRAIREHRSINKAAAAMQLSYVKALKMLDRLEGNFGQQILVRRKGGAQRGGTDLTPIGEQLVAEYERLQHVLRQHADTEYETFKNKMQIGE